MGILSGFFKTKRYRKTETGYKLQSEWTSSDTVEFPDGKTLTEKMSNYRNIVVSDTDPGEDAAVDYGDGTIINIYRNETT